MQQYYIQIKLSISISNCMAGVATNISKLAILRSKVLWSAWQLADFLLAYTLQKTAYSLYLIFLILQIYRYELEIQEAMLCFTLLNYKLSTFPPYLISASYISFPAFFGVHSYITYLHLLITMQWPLIRSSLVVLRFMWCIRTIFGNISSLPKIIAHWSSLLTNVL